MPEIKIELTGEEAKELKKIILNKLSDMFPGKRMTLLESIYSKLIKGGGKIAKAQESKT